MRMWGHRDTGNTDGAKGLVGTRWDTMAQRCPVSPPAPPICPRVPALTLFRSWRSGEKPVSMEMSRMDMVASTLSRNLWGLG